MNRLRELRQKKKLSQKEFAAAFNKFLKNSDSPIKDNHGNVKKISYATVSRWENGQIPIPSIYYSSLADFFGVSLPYLQGLTFSEQELADLLIPLIHKTYFSHNKLILDKPQRIQLTDGFVLLRSHAFRYFDFYIDVYISATTNEPIPRKLYKRNEQDFALTDKVKNYWQTCLAPIFKVMESRDLLKERYGYPSNTDTEALMGRFYRDFTLQAGKLSIDRKNITPLGYMFLTKFDAQSLGYGAGKETLLHEKMRALLLNGNKKKAQKALNEYIEYLLQVRDAVNNFSERDVLLDYFKNMLAKPQNPFGGDLVINELSKEIEDGNNDLLSYVIHRRNASLTKSYYQYKKERGESTKQLDELIKKNNQIKPLFKEKAFGRYFKAHFDSDKSKDTYSEVLRLHEKYMEQKKNS